MLQALDTYDWLQAFAYAGECKGGVDEMGFEVEVWGSPSLSPALPQGRFDTREDVVEILALSEGENDEDSWICAGRLKDGRWFVLDAWCDYTGWG